VVEFLSLRAVETADVSKHAGPLVALGGQGLERVD